MQQSPEELTGSSKSNWFTRKIYETEAEKKKDRWIGIGVFFGVNILMILCGGAVFYLLFNKQMNPGPAVSNLLGGLGCILNLVPWLVNGVLFIYFAVTRTQIALGILIGFGIVFGLSILAGVIFTIWCLVSSSGGSY